MTESRQHDTLLRRAAVGFWFCGVGALGLLRFYLAAFRDGDFAADSIAWIWLVGSIVVSVIGIALVARAMRPRT